MEREDSVFTLVGTGQIGPPVRILPVLHYDEIADERRHLALHDGRVSAHDVLVIRLDLVRLNYHWNENRVLERPCDPGWRRRKEIGISAVRSTRFRCGQLFGHIKNRRAITSHTIMVYRSCRRPERGRVRRQRPKRLLERNRPRNSVSCTSSPPSYP